MRGYGWAGVLGTLMLLGAGSLRASETEARDFAIFIDGKRAGDYQLVIIKQDDGSVVIGADANARVSFLIKTYTYKYHGTEVWKDGRLVRLDSTSNDDGKAFRVAVEPYGKQLHVTVNGQTHATRFDVWTTTYWHLANAGFRNQTVPLLDADTGKDLRGVLRFVGNEARTINGQDQACTHWRVNGDVTVDLWYDAQERVVRQEMVEDGHRTILDLVRIRR